MQKFSPHFLLPNLLAGLTTGLVTLVYSISFAALIFSGNLSPFFPQGLASVLIGATVTAIIIAGRSAFSFVIAGPDSNSAVILALIASAIANSLESPSAAEYLYPTVWAAIILSTIVTGLVLFILGWLRLGRWARFIPYPVIGGFLAGAGWLIVRSSFKVMADIPFEFATLPQLFQLDIIWHWLLGLLFSLALLFAVNFYQHFLIFPGFLIAGIVGFNLLWWLLDNWAINLSHQAWFFQPFPQHELWQAWRFSTFTQIDWSVLIQQSSILVALMVIILISILLNATALELVASIDVDLDRELRINGIANLVNGCCGGMVGYLSSNRSLLNRQAGANNRLAGIISGGLCGAILFSDSSFLAYLPKPILGGLLLYIGLLLLSRWVYQAWFKFPPLDYALILIILVIIAFWGFLPGVGAGIFIAGFLFIFTYGSTSVVKYTLSGATYQSNVQRSFPQQQLLQEQGECTYILVLYGFIFFGTANALLVPLRQRLEYSDLPPLKFVVFDFRLVKGIDSSAVLSFIKMKQLAEKTQIHLVFSQISPQIAQQLRQGGLFGKYDHTCYLFEDLDRGIEWCEGQILARNQWQYREFIPLTKQLELVLPNNGLASKLISYLSLVKIPEGEFLFQQGEPSNGLYFLESGQVTVVLELPTGQAKRLRTYNNGTILGEMGLYGNAPRSASIVADRFSYLYYLSTEAFNTIEKEEPQLAISFHKFIVNFLAERLKRREAELRNFLQ